MKKMLALTLALVMALGLCACGGDTTDNGDPRRKTRRPIPLRKPLRWTFPPWKT